ncbi:hypothetical protein EDC94DRAFT_678790 [Helicostylum pulchrum]|nr:hypothetical protein EDC94DRAFT_678790 [Helicostylum pulchrum]
MPQTNTECRIASRMVTKKNIVSAVLLDGLREQKSYFISAPVALDLSLEPRSLQRWYSTWKKDPNSLFKTIGRPRIIEAKCELAEATRNAVTEFYYKQPTATAEQLLDRLTSTFEGLSLSKSTLYCYLNDLWILSLKKAQLEPLERNTPERIQARKKWIEEMKSMGVDYMNNCVFIDEAGFNANLRRTQGRAPKGELAIVKVLTARANSISILGAIPSKGLIKYERIKICIIEESEIRGVAARLNTGTKNISATIRPKCHDIECGGQLMYLFYHMSTDHTSRSNLRHRNLKYGSSSDNECRLISAKAN